MLENAFVAVAVLFGTVVQFYLQMLELGRLHALSLSEPYAEKQLVAELPRAERRRERRALRRTRTVEVRRALRHVYWTLASWAALVAAASVVFFGTLLPS